MIDYTFPRMRLGIPKETFPGERRVAIVPGVIPALKKIGIDVVVERGAGDAAGFPDASYGDIATISSRSEVFQAEVIAAVGVPSPVDRDSQDPYLWLAGVAFAVLAVAGTSLVMLTQRFYRPRWD